MTRVVCHHYHEHPCAECTAEGEAFRARVRAGEEACPICCGEGGGYRCTHGHWHAMPGLNCPGEEDDR